MGFPYLFELLGPIEKAPPLFCFERGHCLFQGTFGYLNAPRFEAMPLLNGVLREVELRPTAGSDPGTSAFPRFHFGLLAAPNAGSALPAGSPPLQFAKREAPLVPLYSGSHSLFWPYNARLS